PVSAAMLETTPSRTNCRAIAVPAHCDRERPSSSGRWQANVTTSIATAGGKDRLATTPRAVVPAGAATPEAPLDPLADRLLGPADPPGHGDQGGALGDFEDGPAAPGQAQGGRRVA